MDERGVEVLDRLEPGAVGLVEPRVVELDARARALGRVHRDVRAAQQIGDRARCVSSRSAMPALASMRTRAPSMTIGCMRRSRIRSATWRTSSSAPSVIRSANSSPPRRTSRSGSTMRAARRRAVSRSSSSPAWWPSVSLISLKLSRSIRISASRSARSAASQAQLAVLEEGAPVPETGELVGDGLAAGVGQALDLAEAHQGPGGGEQQREGRQCHDGGGQLAEGGDDEHDDRGQRGQHRDGQDRLRASGLDLRGDVAAARCEGDARDAEPPQHVQRRSRPRSARVDAQRIDDVGGAEDGEPAGQPQPQRSAAQCPAPRARRRSSRPGAGPRPCKRRRPAPTSSSPCAAESTGLSTAASAVAPPAAPSAPSSQSALGKDPWSRRTRHTIAAATRHVEAQVREIRGRRDGRVGLELQPGREDHVAGRLREHRQRRARSRRRGADRPGPRAGEARDVGTSIAEFPIQP